MPYAIPYNHLAAIPVGILLVYVTLFIVQLFSKYAMLFWPEGSQQTDLAIQKDSSSNESTPKRSQGLAELFRSNSRSPGKSSVSGGDSTTFDITRTTESNDINITRTVNNSSTEDKNSKEHFCEKLPQECDGTATGPSERGTLPIQGGNSEHDRLYESSTSQKNSSGPQSSANRGIGQAAACKPYQGNCANVRHEKVPRMTRAIQIYLKHKELGTHPPYVADNEEADLLVFNFVQSIMQQMQQHMFKQLEQCMQQAYSGLLLGTPVHAKEYTEQFKKNNNTILLTETKQLGIVPNQSDWDNDQDFTSHGDTASPPPPPSISAKSETVPKTITQTENSFGGACRKTGFSIGKTRSTAVVSG